MLEIIDEILKVIAKEMPVSAGAIEIYEVMSVSPQIVMSEK